MDPTGWVQSVAKNDVKIPPAALKTALCCSLDLDFWGLYGKNDGVARSVLHKIPLIYIVIRIIV